MKHSEGSICLMLGYTTGKNRPDINYLRFCCDVPEHYEALKAKGYDCREKTMKRILPVSAANYIIQTVFEHNSAQSDTIH